MLSTLYATAHPFLCPSHGHPAAAASLAAVAAMTVATAAVAALATAD